MGRTIGRGRPATPQETVNMFTVAPGSSGAPTGKQSTCLLTSTAVTRRRPSDSDRPAGARPPSPAEDRELVPLDRKSSHPRRDPHGIETAPELQGVVAGEGEDGQFGPPHTPAGRVNP